MTSKAVGIDLGTTYSAVAIYENQRVELIPDTFGNRIMPSIVCFIAENYPIIGAAAKPMAEDYLSSTVVESKRIIGKRYYDAKIADSTTIGKQTLPYKIFNDRDNASITLNLKNSKSFVVTPEQIASLILDKLMDTARKYLGMDINDAVITVPAYFTDSQLQATMDAAEIAGIHVLQLLKEPCAAAIAYGFHSDIGAKKNVVVYDLGGGTFDVSVMEISAKSYNVLAYDGDSQLGGVDFDNRLFWYFGKIINYEHRVDIFADTPAALIARYRLKAACEQAKKDLSTTSSTLLKIPAIFPQVDFKKEITREKFDRLCGDLYEQTIKIVRKVLKTAMLTPGDIDEVVLAGGSTRIKRIRQLLQQEFGATSLCQHIHPDEAVAYGAAVQAALITSEDYATSSKFQIESDKLAHAIGQGLADGSVMEIIPKNSSIPKGAQALQIERSVFPLYSDQQSITIAIFEGESSLQSECVLLGNFKLDNLQPTSFWRQTEVKCTYRIDRNGILTVSAEEVSSYKPNKMSVKINKSRLSEKQIKDAIKFMADCKKDRAEKQEAYNSLLMQLDFKRADD